MVQSQLSPMMQHYVETKKEYPDCILFYRLGDFYEMFFEDALTVSKELEITLTGKDCGLDERAPMCGVPYHAVESYLYRLVQKGYKVAMGYSFHIFTKFSRVGPDGNNFRPLERVISVMDLRDVITIHDNGSSTRRQPVIRTTYPSSNTSLFLFVLVIAQQPPENNSYKVTYHKNIY